MALCLFSRSQKKAVMGGFRGKLMADRLVEGVNLYKRKDYTGALSFFLSLPEASGRDALDIAYYTGLCYFNLDRYDDAMVYLEQVVTSVKEGATENERVHRCRYILAVIYCKTGQTQLANFELDALLKSGYKNASVYASFAYLSWEAGNVDQCIEFYEKSLSTDPNNATALNGLGYVLASEGKDLSRALSLCKKALDIVPGSAACLDSVGWVYYRMGLYSQARKYLEQALKKDNDNELIRQHLQDAELVEE